MPRRKDGTYTFNPGTPPRKFYPELNETIRVLSENQINIKENLGISVDNPGGDNQSFTQDEKQKLENLPVNAEENVQSDWSESDDTNDAFIRNKPTIPTIPTVPPELTNAQVKTKYEANSNTNAYTDAEKTKLSGLTQGGDNVQSDWSETNARSDAFIQNKPTIPDVVMPNSSGVLRDATITDFQNHAIAVQNGNVLVADRVLLTPASDKRVSFRDFNAASDLPNGFTYRGIVGTSNDLLAVPSPANNNVVFLQSSNKLFRYDGTNVILGQPLGWVPYDSVVVRGPFSDESEATQRVTNNSQVVFLSRESILKVTFNFRAATAAAYQYTWHPEHSVQDLNKRVSENTGDIDSNSTEIDDINTELVDHPPSTGAFGVLTAETKTVGDVTFIGYNRASSSLFAGSVSDNTIEDFSGLFLLTVNGGSNSLFSGLTTGKYYYQKDGTGLNPEYVIVNNRRFSVRRVSANSNFFEINYLAIPDFSNGASYNVQVIFENGDLLFVNTSRTTHQFSAEIVDIDGGINEITSVKDFRTSNHIILLDVRNAEKSKGGVFFLYINGIRAYGIQNASLHDGINEISIGGISYEILEAIVRSSPKELALSVHFSADHYDTQDYPIRVVSGFSAKILSVNNNTIMINDLTELQNLNVKYHVNGFFNLTGGVRFSIEGGSATQTQNIARRDIREGINVLDVSLSNRNYNAMVAGITGYTLFRLHIYAQDTQGEIYKIYYFPPNASSRTVVSIPDAPALSSRVAIGSTQSFVLPEATVTNGSGVTSYDIQDTPDGVAFNARTRTVTVSGRLNTGSYTMIYTAENNSVREGVAVTLHHVQIAPVNHGVPHKISWVNHPTQGVYSARLSVNWTVIYYTDAYGGGDQAQRRRRFIVTRREGVTQTPVNLYVSPAKQSLSVVSGDSDSWITGASSSSLGFNELNGQEYNLEFNDRTWLYN